MGLLSFYGPRTLARLIEGIKSKLERMKYVYVHGMASGPAVASEAYSPFDSIYGQVAQHLEIIILWNNEPVRRLPVLIFSLGRGES